MADEPVEELDHLALEFRRFVLKLGNGVSETVRDLHVFAAQLLKQLHIMVAGNAQRRSGIHHVHD